MKTFVFALLLFTVVLSVVPVTVGYSLRRPVRALQVSIISNNTDSVMVSTSNKTDSNNTTDVVSNDDEPSGTQKPAPPFFTPPTALAPPITMTPTSPSAPISLTQSSEPTSAPSTMEQGRTKALQSVAESMTELEFFFETFGIVVGCFGLIAAYLSGCFGFHHNNKYLKLVKTGNNIANFQTAISVEGTYGPSGTNAGVPAPTSPAPVAPDAENSNAGIDDTNAAIGVTAGPNPCDNTDAGKASKAVDEKATKAKAAKRITELKGINEEVEKALKGLLKVPLKVP